MQGRERNSLVSLIIALLIKETGGKRRGNREGAREKGGDEGKEKDARQRGSREIYVFHKVACKKLFVNFYDFRCRIVPLLKTLSPSQD